MIDDACHDACLERKLKSGYGGGGSDAGSFHRRPGAPNSLRERAPFRVRSARAEEAQLHACTAGSITLHMSLVLRCFHLLPACFGLVLDALGERSVRDAPQEKGIDMLEDEAADDWFPSPRVREFATKDACGGAERGRRSTDLWVSESCR